jgi:hypothetical protein
MKREIATLTTAIALAWASQTLAQDKPAPEVATANNGNPSPAQLEQMAAGPPGVVVAKIGKDSDGRLISCYIVGKSRISTVLGTAKGVEIAQQRARNAAVTAFLKWLKEDVRVIENQNDETISLLEGTEEAGKADSKRESSKAVEKNSVKFQSISQGLVRGLQVVYYNQDGDNKTYILVMKWSASKDKAARETERETNQGGAKDSGAKRKPDDKTIPNKKGTVPSDDGV